MHKSPSGDEATWSTSCLKEQGGPLVLPPVVSAVNIYYIIICAFKQKPWIWTALAQSLYESMHCVVSWCTHSCRLDTMYLSWSCRPLILQSPYPHITHSVGLSPFICIYVCHPVHIHTSQLCRASNFNNLNSSQWSPAQKHWPDNTYDIFWSFYWKD